MGGLWWMDLMRSGFLLSAPLSFSCAAVRWLLHFRRSFLHLWLILVVVLFSVQVCTQSYYLFILCFTRVVTYTVTVFTMQSLFNYLHGKRHVGISLNLPAVMISMFLCKYCTIRWYKCAECQIMKNKSALCWCRLLVLHNSRVTLNNRNVFKRGRRNCSSVNNKCR